MENTTITEGKTMAIISYITYLGAITAYFMNNDKKNSFAAFHIRQMIGLSLMSIANGIIFTKMFKSPTASIIITIGILILWVIGFIGAIKGEKKLVPLIGEQFQEWFKKI